MPRITYRQQDGTMDTHDVPVGISVMRGAVTNGVRGIVAECGGAAQCGTCHVFVDRSVSGVLPPMDELEDDVLYGTAEPRRDTSRLSCQLAVTEATDGLVVEVPRTQT